MSFLSLNEDASKVLIIDACDRDYLRKAGAVVNMSWGYEEWIKYGWEVILAP